MLASPYFHPGFRLSQFFLGLLGLLLPSKGTQLGGLSFVADMLLIGDGGLQLSIKNTNRYTLVFLTVPVK